MCWESFLEKDDRALGSVSCPKLKSQAKYRDKEVPWKQLLKQVVSWYKKLIDGHHLGEVTRTRAQ